MRRTALLVVICLLASACGRFVRVEMLPVDLPAIDAPQQTLVYAADGSLIATLRFANRENVTFAELPDVLVDAVVAAEDRTFFTHNGIDLRAILRAWVANQRSGEIVQGGSTITQQLIKNQYFPQAEETFERKAAEAQLALELERSTPKEEILTDYFNTVYFGSGAYGIQAAARTYFGIDVGHLDLAQAALLVGLIRAPESASPYRHPDRARDARDSVLQAMVDAGFLARTTADQASAQPLGVQPPPPPPETRFPYFVEFVKRSLLADPTFGPDESARVRRLFGGGLRVYTTIDPELQGHAEAAARAYWSGPDDPEVAIAVVRPTDGHLLAAVGGRDFSQRQFDLATQARRQPGSTFKTFALVAALQSGMRLDDLVDSGPAALEVPGGETWQVRSATSGLLTLRDALVLSSNGAFARLALQLGGARIAHQANAMGVISPVSENPAIVLGGLDVGVSPLDLAASYATLANGGVHLPTTGVSHVTDADGHVVWGPDTDPRVAMDGETAWLATQALVAAVEEGTGQAARMNRPVAGKTGTVQGYRDAWFVGFTPQLSTAVWIGHPAAPHPLLNIHGVSRVTGGSWPARIWRTFMESALAGEPVTPFVYPEHQEITVLVDPLSEGLATQWCPLVVERTGLPGALPATPCPLHGPPTPPPPPPSIQATTTATATTSTTPTQTATEAPSPTPQPSPTPPAPAPEPAPSGPSPTPSPSAPETEPP